MAKRQSRKPVDGKVLCADCGFWKPIAEMAQYRKGEKIYYHDCLECNQENQRQRRAANPEKVAAWNAEYRTRPGVKEADAARQAERYRTNEKTRRITKNSGLKFRYGISLEDFDVMLLDQRCVCIICGEPQIMNNAKYATTQLVVDHDHRNGEVRGLLCMNCNHGIGNFKDDPELLLAAAAYLLKTRDIIGRQAVCT